MSDPDSRTESDEGGAADAEPPQRLSIDVIVEDGDWSRFPRAAQSITAAARMLARAPGLLTGEAEACIALSSDVRVAALNGAYRGKPKPTNVLSFPSAHPHPDDGGVRHLGDIVLAAETVASEAAVQDIPPVHHLQHLVVHGLLHLLGFDHETEAAAEEMEALETAILARLGIADPYAVPVAG